MSDRLRDQVALLREWGLGGLGGGAAAAVAYTALTPAVSFTQFVAVGIFLGAFCSNSLGLVISALTSDAVIKEDMARINEQLHEKNLTATAAAQLRLETMRRETVEESRIVKLVRLVVRKIVRGRPETSLRELKPGVTQPRAGVTHSSAVSQRRLEKRRP